MLPPTKAYLCREIIAWGDCVKLRHGAGPEDNPWPWTHTAAYAVGLVATFHDFCIDNCHSTPLHVGAYLLEAARVANPDLYVCAELCRGSEEMDFVFGRGHGTPFDGLALADDAALGLAHPRSGRHA